MSNASLSSGMGRLLADGAKEYKLPPRQGGPGDAEVYSWTGASYKPSRTPFVRTLLQSALTSAGYTYREIDPSYENTPNIYADHLYGTGALDIALVDGRPVHFYATNPKAGKTVVGVWIDQPSHNRLVLALSAAGGVDAPTETKAPPVSGADMWLVKDLMHATKGMPQPPMPAFPKLAARPRTVRGVVLDGSGKPIVGAHLIAHSSAAGGFRTSFEGRTDARGIYEIPLPVGICQVVNADCRVSYNGKNMLLPLHPADGERDNFNAAPGHVENFVLRTGGGGSGEGGEEADYGAPMRVLTYDAPDGGVVELSLKPIGPLMDGSRGRTLVFRWPSRPSAGSHSAETFLSGIPAGRYTLTAKVYEGEDALPLRAKKTFGDGGDEPQLVAEMPVEFESVQAGNLATLGRSGIKRFEVTLRP
jgi:hypothetical protein